MKRWLWRLSQSDPAVNFIISPRRRRDARGRCRGVVVVVAVARSLFHVCFFPSSRDDFSPVLHEESHFLFSWHRIFWWEIRKSRWRVVVLFIFCHIQFSNSLFVRAFQLKMQKYHRKELVGRMLTRNEPRRTDHFHSFISFVELDVPTSFYGTVPYAIFLHTDFWEGHRSILWKRSFFCSTMLQCGIKERKRLPSQDLASGSWIVFIFTGLYPVLVVGQWNTTCAGLDVVLRFVYSAWRSGCCFPPISIGVAIEMWPRSLVSIPSRSRRIGGPGFSCLFARPRSATHFHCRGLYPTAISSSVIYSSTGLSWFEWLWFDRRLSISRLFPFSCFFFKRKTRLNQVWRRFFMGTLVLSGIGFEFFSFCCCCCRWFPFCAALVSVVGEGVLWRDAAVAVAGSAVSLMGRARADGNSVIAR